MTNPRHYLYLTIIYLGIVVGVCQEFQIPIRFIGLGEGLDDLKEFDPKQFVEALF